jgi:APA family basic amino acid/polyamine antiporter
VLPKWFRFQNDAPTFAIFIQAALAIAVVQISNLKQLLGYLGFTLSLCAALTVSTIFLLKRRGEDVRVPFYPWPPLIFVAATVMVAVIAGFRQPKECLAGLATLAVGIVVYKSGIVEKQMQRSE